MLTSIVVIIMGAMILLGRNFVIAVGEVVHDMAFGKKLMGFRQAIPAEVWVFGVLLAGTGCVSLLTQVS